MCCSGILYFRIRMYQGSVRLYSIPCTSVNPVIDANNRFSFDLYSHLAGNAANRDPNLFFSQWSLSSAMAVTCDGAWNRTASEIENVLHLPENRSVLCEGYPALNSRLNQITPCQYPANGKRDVSRNNLFLPAGIFPGCPEILWCPC